MVGMADDEESGDEETNIKTYPLETDEVVWELLLDTIPRRQTINEHFQTVIRKRIAETFTAEQLEDSPRYSPEHVAKFLEITEECERIEG